MKKVTLIRPDLSKLRTQFVSLGVDECAQLLRHEITYDGKLLDQHELAGPEGRKAVVCVYERYYFRAGNYVTITITIDDLTGRTRVHFIGGGGGDSALINEDGGAAQDFESAVSRILKPHACSET